MPEKFQILGVNISAVNLESAARAFDESIRAGTPNYVCVAPVSTIISCQDDPAYRQVVNEADIVTPDGMPVVWLAHWMGYRDVRRTYGPDLLCKVCQEGLAKNYRHFFYGGTDEVIMRLKDVLSAQFPGIKIVGHYVPPFKAKITESQAVLDQINNSQADIVWVGLGSPKQDFWMAQHRARINVPIMVGVGAAFDFLSGVKPQAPKWVQHAGLEWLFRLCCEPRRLWKRYLVGNSRFILYVLTDILRGKIRRGSNGFKAA